ncbi:MAG: FAD-dependent oxidoreductase [Alphaproteobacteria bacterium]|nr:FAD-dependent oxidoreductase [Alphaproteobacteria bacterium]
MATTLNADLCIIGGGSGGLALAAGAAQMGAVTVLVEAGKMGGDCLNYGCVPSKAMISAGHAGHVIRHADRFGVNGHEPEVDFKGVHAHVHGVIGAIAPHDSVERFEGLGVTVLKEHARFLSAEEIEAGATRVKARRFAVATGSSPVVPPIPGLADVPHDTNETIFDNQVAPSHLIVIGGGPIGAELAQAHRRLGAEVTIVDMGPILPKDDPEMTAVVRAKLEADGVVLKERVKVQKIEAAGNGVAVIIEEDDGASQRLEGSNILVATGRAANVEGLNLEAAGVDYDRRGIKIDRRLRTSNKKIYALGDVTGGYQFTHVAGYHAGIVIQNALFRLPAKVDYKALPWVTYTDPELAHVGLTEAEVDEKGLTASVLRWSFEENDRAQTERRTNGGIKVMVGKRGKVLGATIVGAHAGELILPWVLAINQGIKIKAMASVIAPYPTLSEVSKRAAGSYFTPKLFSDRTRWLVRFLSRFG